MTNAHLYLSTIVPQWGIFTGIVLLTIGYVDKKELWTRLGWIVLIATSVAALYFNLLGELSTPDSLNLSDAGVSLLIATGWQTATGGVLGIASLLMLLFKKKRYPVLAILTITYFILMFFLYIQVSGATGKAVKPGQVQEQKN
jgi:hypothetical protein